MNAHHQDGDPRGQSTSPGPEKPAKRIRCEESTPSAYVLAETPKYPHWCFIPGSD